MVHQHVAAARAAPYDMARVIKRVGLEITAGLNVNDNDAVAALAHRMEHDLLPRIMPDRRYSIRELVEKFGYTRGLLYKRYKHLIRKDGRKSFILGRDLLSEMESAPRLAAVVPVAVTGATAPPARCERGRPHKVMVEPVAATPEKITDAHKPALL